MLKDRLKILLVAPSPDLAGGIARWTKHILHYHSIHKDDCDLVFLSQTHYHYSINKGVFNRVISGCINYLNVIFSFRNKLSKENYDVIHITTSASIGLLKDIVLLKIARSKKVKTVIHFRFGRIPDLFESKNWEWKLLSKVVKLTDIAITIDLKSYSTLVEAGFGNIVNLPNPISDEILNEIAIKEKSVKTPRSIVFVGQMLKTKGVYELVEVCSQIPNIKLNMFGMIPSGVKEELQQLAGKNHKQWLNIVGEIEYRTIPTRMQESTIFVLPTYTEGFPNVILESMACGCPIIASAVGAIPEMLHIESNNPCGICVTPKNKVELKEKIEYLLDNPNELQILGNRAKMRVVVEYSMSAVWERLLNIWSK